MDRGKTNHQDRRAIAMAIAQEMLDKGILDENNFSNDLNALLEYVSEIILDYLKDYMLIIGTLV